MNGFYLIAQGLVLQDCMKDGWTLIRPLVPKIGQEKEGRMGEALMHMSSATEWIGQAAPSLE